MAFEKGVRPPGAKVFTKDYQPERKRQPAEIKRLQDTGYNIEDIRKGITTTLTMTVDDLERLSQRDTAPIIFRIMGKAALTAFKKGDLDPIKEMFKYIFPKGATVNVQQNFAGPETTSAVSIEIIEVTRATQNGPVFDGDEPMSLDMLIKKLNPET